MKLVFKPEWFEHRGKPVHEIAQEYYERHLRQEGKVVYNEGDVLWKWSDSFKKTANQKAILINIEPIKTDKYQITYEDAEGKGFVRELTPEEINRLDLFRPKVDEVSKCICPDKKNDGSPFDGVSYHCPLHGR